MKSSRKALKKEMAETILAHTEATNGHDVTTHLLASFNTPHAISHAVYTTLYESLSKITHYTGEESVYTLYSKLFGLSGGCSERLEVAIEAYRDMIDKHVSDTETVTGKPYTSPKASMAPYGKRTRGGKMVIPFPDMELADDNLSPFVD